MNIINLLKKLFFKEEHIGIINIGDLIQIPGRDYFNNNSDNLNKIDNYKEEYYKIISKKILSSKELSLDDLDNLMLMNIDLILRLFLDEDIISSEIENEINSYVDREVKIKKIKIYLEEIKNMEDDTISKLIALKELEKGKRIPKLNRFILNEKINQLSLSLLSFENRKFALQKEIYNHNLINNIPIDKIDECNKIAISKYKDILNLSYPYLDKDKLTSIINLNEDIYTKIAYLEKELEIYVYNNKDTRLLMIKEVRNLLKEYQNLKKEDILTKIKEIEDKYTIFDKYGRNIIKKEDWYDLYNIKFKVLTRDINKLDSSPLMCNSKIEKECYEEIIFNMINNILQEKNKNIKKIFGDYRKEAINNLILYLKGGLEKFNYDWIINDKLKLSLLLAFDAEDGLDKFFRENKITQTEARELIKFNYNKSIFDFEDILSLDTCLQVIYAYEHNNKHYNYPLYNIYKLSKKEPIICDKMINSLIDALPVTSDLIKYYYLPNGLTKINGANLNYYNDPLVKQINNECKKSIIIFPSSFIETHDRLFDDKTQLVGVKLNEGIKYINRRAFMLQRISILSIPSSVELLSDQAFEFSYVKVLNFLDYKNSYILHDRGNLLMLIQSLFKVEPVENGRGTDIIATGNIKVYRERITVKLSTNLEKLNLYDINNNLILTIKGKDLEYEKNRWRTNPQKNVYNYYDNWDNYLKIYKTSIEDAEEILEKIKTIIETRLNYTLEFKKLEDYEVMKEIRKKRLTK